MVTSIISVAFPTGRLGLQAESRESTSGAPPRAHLGGVSKHNLEASCASVVDIKVGAAMAVEDEVKYRVGALDEERVCAEGLEE